MDTEEKFGSRSFDLKERNCFIRIKLFEQKKEQKKLKTGSLKKN